MPNCEARGSEADTHGTGTARAGGIWAERRAHAVSCVGAVGVNVQQELHHQVLLRRGIVNGIVQRQTSELRDAAR